MKKYCALFKRMYDDVKNITKDLRACDWGDGSAEECVFDTKAEAEEIIQKFDALMTNNGEDFKWYDTSIEELEFETENENE